MRKQRWGPQGGLVRFLQRKAKSQFYAGRLADLSSLTLFGCICFGDKVTDLPRAASSTMSAAFVSKNRSARQTCPSTWLRRPLMAFRKAFPQPAGRWRRSLEFGQSPPGPRGNTRRRVASTVRRRSTVFGLAPWEVRGPRRDTGGAAPVGPRIVPPPFDHRSDCRWIYRHRVALSGPVHADHGGRERDSGISMAASRPNSGQLGHRARIGGERRSNVID